MPYTCGYPFCSSMSDRPGYCPSHKAKAEAARQHTYDDSRRNAAAKAFYGSQAWSNCRLTILSQRPDCESCRNALATDVHHIKPLAGYWALRLEPTNLMPVCGTCHKRIERYRLSSGDRLGVPEIYSDE